MAAISTAIGAPVGAYRGAPATLADNARAGGQRVMFGDVNCATMAAIICAIICWGFTADACAAVGELHAASDFTILDEARRNLILLTNEIWEKWGSTQRTGASVPKTWLYIALAKSFGSMG